MIRVLSADDGVGYTLDDGVGCISGTCGAVAEDEEKDAAHEASAVKSEIAVETASHRLSQRSTSLPLLKV
jgi:hypothetical protein